MPQPPTLTVYMPLYNAERYVGAAIESILEQTFSDFELLVVDDGSTDGSAAVVESVRDARVRLIRQENRGCYPARNRAIAEARGRYLANMDADDLSLPTRFEKQIAYLEAHPEAVLVGTKTYECDMDDSVRLPRRDPDSYEDSPQVPFQVNRKMAQRFAPFVPGTMMLRASLIGRIGSYDERLCYCGDLDLIARAALVGPISCLPDIEYVIRLLPTSISSAGTMIQREVTDFISRLAERVEKGQPREFSPDEVSRLKELEKAREGIPKTPPRKKVAFYHTRLSTLHRMNSMKLGALRHALLAVLYSPTSLLLDRKLQSNLLRSLVPF